MMESCNIEMLAQYVAVLIILVVAVVYIIKRTTYARRCTNADKGECSSCLLQDTCAKKPNKRQCDNYKDRQL